MPPKEGDMASDVRDILEKRGALSRKLDAIGWGVFFVWMGLIELIKIFPKGSASIGIGVIILGESIARVVCQVSVSGFWIFLGVVFLLGGLGEIYAVNIPLLPIVFLIAGVLLIVRQTTKTKKME